MSLRALLMALICLSSAGAGFALYAWYRGEDGQRVVTIEADPSAVVFTDLDGAPRRLSEWRGRWLLVNFWATWCAPCVNEIPILVDAQTRWASRGLQVLGPALDAAELAAAMAERLGVNYPVFYGDVEIVRAMTALGDSMGALPFSVLLDPAGRIVYQKYGEFDSVGLERVLKHFIEGRG